ncbi:MAG: ABC transporter ATP-binding protein [Rickettsiales bacterium]|nr:ABC transporter ATP-binding protein [Rickettsiales bacterium]
MLLKVKNLYKKFGSVVAANNINFSMQNNETIGVIGSNGAGKTTFCNMITGYTKADEGEIFLKESNITKKSVQDIKKIGIHRSFQIPQIFENLSVLENIIVAHLVAKNKQNTISEKAVNKENVLLSEDMLEKFNLISSKDVIANTLPQGVRKVLDILIAIQGNPLILLLDEPTSGVSSDEKNKLMQSIISSLEALNISVMFVEHDMEIVEKFSRRVIAFYNGEIIADGNPQEVLSKKDVKKYIVG